MTGSLNLNGKDITLCSVCVNCEIDKTKAPCDTCPDNKNYTSHFKPHPVYQAIIDAGVFDIPTAKGGKNE